ncbi:MAG: diacylglycerol kinase family protein [Spirochaetaceae bacterium]
MSAIKRIKNKFTYAFKGLYIAFTSDNSFKVHFAVSIPIIISGFILNFSSFEWIVIIISIGQVLVAELFNTAIEYIVKMFTDEYHELAEKLLDISAGAVLLAVIISAILGCLIYIPHFMNLK